jgi:hypothetical protein
VAGHAFEKHVESHGDPANEAWRLKRTLTDQLPEEIDYRCCHHRGLQWRRDHDSTDLFKQQLRESLKRETLNTRVFKIAKHANVYRCGDQDEMVYFIETGQIKLLMLSSEGKECLLAIHAAGDIFGELCLAGLGARLGTATAMKPNNVEADTQRPVLHSFKPRVAV